MILIFSFLVLGGVCSSESTGFCLGDGASDKMGLKKGRITKMRLKHPLENEGTKNKEWLCALGDTGNRKQMEEDWKNDLSGLMSEVAGTWRTQNASSMLVGMAFVQQKTRSLFIVEKYSAVCICSSILVRDANSPISFENRESVLRFVNLTLEHESQNEAVQSICFAEGKESSISMDNCLVSDLRFCGSGLICGIDSHSFSIKNTIIHNITREGKLLQTDKPSAIGRKTEESSIENCLLISTENAFFGSVIFGLKGAVRFHCKNTSVISNRGRNDGYTSQSRINTSDSVSLSNSEWIDCNSTTNGGAIHITGNTASTLTLSNCYFQGNIAQSGRGGAIYAASISQISICDSIFLNCQATNGNFDEEGGAICIESPQNTYIIKNSSFRNCFAGNDGGGLCVYAKSNNATGDCISDCLFYNCTTSNSSSPIGGGTQIWNMIAYPNISNCQFTKNYAFWGGGGISISGSQNVSIKVLFFCFFHENTGGVGGCDILLQNQSSNAIDRNCYSTRQTGIRVGIDFYSIVDRSEWLRNDGGRVRFVSSIETQPHAMDAFVCGINESYPCSTISYCLTQLIPEFVKDIKILTGIIIVTKNVDCGADGLSIYGESDLSSTIQTELEAAGLSLFSASTGTLTVNDISLVHNSAHVNNRGSKLFEIVGTGEMHISRLNISAGSGHSAQTAFSTELINIQNGVLQMERVNWAKAISAVSLFSLSSTYEISLTLSECAFDGIERTTSGAAVISFSNDKASIELNSCSFFGCGSTTSTDGGSMILCVGDGNEVKVNGGSFDECFCSTLNGLGGGILLQLLNENPDFLISSSFGANTAKWGRDIFVLSPNLEVIAKSQNITCVTASTDSADRVRGFDNGNTSVAIPLCIYLLPTPEEIYVSNAESYDHLHCGIAQFPCLTLKHSLTHQTEEKKVIVKGTIPVCDEFVLSSQKHVIRGNDDQSGWTVSDASTTSNSALLTATIETELSRLIFSLPSSLPLHSTFISSSSQLTLSQCSLSLQNPSSELECMFLSVNSGPLAIDSFLASSIVLNGCPLISLSGSSTEANLKSVQLNEIVTNYASGLIEVRCNASLQMSDSDISSIVSSEGIASSRLISTTDAKIIEIIRTGISNFAVKGQNGGAIECTLESSCSLMFEEGNLSSCKSEGGNGGGLWVQMKSGSSFSIGNGTESLSSNGNENEQVKKMCFSSCEASTNIEGSKGLGGGIYIYLDEEASDFVLRSVQFDGCKGKKGKDVFLDADDLSIVTSTAIFCFDADMNELDKLNGFERSTTNEGCEIPLVVYLWNNFTAPCHVGGQNAHDFSGCGYVQIPCNTITKAVGLRFSGEKKSIKLDSPFSFGEELRMDSKEWIVTGDGNASHYGISFVFSGIQIGVFETHIQTTFSEVVFSLEERIASYECVFHCVSNKLSIQNCGVMASENQLDISFVKIEGGEVMISNLFGNAIRWQTSAIVVDGRSGGAPSIEIMESNFSGNGEQNGCLIECRNIQYLNASQCHATAIDRAAGSGGCISIDNSNDENENVSINIEECTFECCVQSDESRGGAVFVQMKMNTQLNIISCAFTGCTAPGGEDKTGFGGGMALKLIDDDSSFVISSPIFDTDKPNVAKYGNDLFVESPNLAKSITNASLPFVSENLVDVSLDSMRGFDGSDTTNAIPLVYFWFSLGLEIFIGGNGKDVCICGFLDYPCLSMEHSLTRLPEGNERNINIIGKGVLQKCVDISGVSIKSSDEEVCTLESASSLKGAEGAAMKICGITNFELMKFVIPSSFTSGINYLMHIGSSEGLLTVKDCSFTKKGDNREEMINFGLIKADVGAVLLNFESIQSLRFEKDVISVLSSTILNIKNLTMKDVQLDRASGLSISKSSGREKNEEEQDIVIEWSLFEEVTQNTTNDIPIIRNTNDDEPLKMVIRNTTMRKCGGLKCGKGGGMFCVLNEGGKFDCSFCSISECFCSTTGRGGWLFLGCTSTVEQPLNFVLSNITFKDNSAFRGRDVYVRCHSIENQIADEQFLLDFRAPFVKELAIWGCTADTFLDEEDLLLRVVKYQSETIFVSSVADNHSDSKQCGEFSMPCNSLNDGVQHIIPSLFSQLLILGETDIFQKCDVHDVTIRSLQSPSTALVHLNSTIASYDEGNVITTSGKVRIERLNFNFGQPFSYSGSSIIHQASGELSLSFVDFSSVGESESVEAVVLNSTLLSIENGILHVDNCSISFLSFNKPSFLLSGDRISLANAKLKQIEASENVFELGDCKNVVFDRVSVDGANLSEGCIFSINDITLETISLVSASFENCTRNSPDASILSVSLSSFTHAMFSNCSCESCISTTHKGSIINICDSENISLSSCSFSGMLANQQELGNDIAADGICKWNGSLVHIENSNLQSKEIMIKNSSKGGITIKGGRTFIEMGMLANNNPFIEKYPSLRRNIICSDSASITISSLKGGDGVKDNSSLWVLNDGCTLGGIAGERESPFFIPKLESALVVGSEAEEYNKIRFKGSLFLPCGLSFGLTYTTGDEKLIEKYDFNEDGFISEGEVECVIHSSNLTTALAETEVAVSILFGNPSFPSKTESFILKNRSEPKQKEEEKSVESGKGVNSLWIIIVVSCIVFIVLLLIIVAVTIRWRKQKRRTEELEVIVNDTVKKDPKAFEMVTMEMSPEEQWRRAEREAEKKNEERIKKRVYETNMEHSESSEHLLSESGSTEYILGKDSDKIPEWVLEKVDDEEETRKRSPSPSISSTSTTDTSDTESTFVRGRICVQPPHPCRIWWMLWHVHRLTKS
ncbi:uncharacterized protein MONOS_14714 [Monocercomonoides exilis]|uniref:uncharacterized protein n=1 Tax=Monocercomonoides exilis TaxID=2049356 RepID=UPI00355A35D9|nr:hypothetical protein MONOS_14714 [Monocercomonoides exilis]